MLLWHGKKITFKIKKASRERIKEGCQLVEAETKALLNLKGGRTESGGISDGKELGLINSYRSKPGEPPRHQTGDLMGSVTYELAPVLPIGRVGTNLEYARALELGYEPRNLKPRPYLRPALYNSAGALRAIFGRRVI